MYGIMLRRFGLMRFEPPSSDLTPLQNPKRRQPTKAPPGENLPKMTAAIAMKPWPTMTAGRNCDTVARVTKAPPRPDRKPDRITQT